MIQNEKFKISNYVPPHFFNRYDTLQKYCKQARENNVDLRTKIIFGSDDLILQEKKVGEKFYNTVNINKYGTLPNFDLNLLWPSQEVDIPLNTPPKGRPIPKRPLSSPDSSPNASQKPKGKKKKNNLKATLHLVTMNHHLMMKQLKFPNFITTVIRRKPTRR